MKKYLLALLVVSTGALGQIAGTKYSTCIEFIQDDVPITASPLTLTARASSGVPVTFSSKTPTICAVAGGVATLKLAGVCTIVAKSAATPAYMGGQTPLSFNVTAVLGPPPKLEWVRVAGENESFVVAGEKIVRYGAATSWIEKRMTGQGECTNNFFGGDPIVGQAKTCEAKDADGAPPPPPPPTGCDVGTICKSPMICAAPEKDFARTNICPATSKIEPSVCAGYKILSTDGTACIDSAACKWVSK
jgi:hypothetical protein